MTESRSDTVSDEVRQFYEDVGWEEHDGLTEDALRWEDSRAVAKAYVSRCRRRVQAFIPEKGDRFLDAASGPVQYPEYSDYSSGYRERYCVDFSSKALERAKEQLGDHAVTVQGNIVDLDLPGDFFDCTVSLHTIYHIAADQQETAVRNLLRMTRPGKPVIIVYSNPDSLQSRASRLLRPNKKASEQDLYFSPHPLGWWDRFEDIASVSVEPWRFLAAEDSRKLIPDNFIGRKLLDWLFRWEGKYPRAAARWGRYPMIVLVKSARH